MTMCERRDVITAMLSRWRRDEARLEKMFNGGEEFSDGTEILRNLGTAIAYANGWLASGRSRTPGEEPKR